MNAGNELVIGIVLIAAGLALAILGYVIFTNREDEQAEDDSPPEEPEELVESPGAAEADRVPATLDEAAEFDEPVDISLPPWVLPEKEDAAGLEETPARPAPEQEVAALPEPEPEHPPTESTVEHIQTAQRRIAIASILRDEVTGEIHIKVGDREYASARDLRESQDWTKVEYAARDLVGWMEAAAPELRTSDRVRESSPGPKSMIQQINDILQDEIASSPTEKRGIRLMESADGSVRVLLGVQSYALDDVPDESVQTLIRKAVAIWEKSQ